MLRKLLILAFSFCLSSSVVADISTDIADGVEVNPTTQNAKNDNVTAEDAVAQLIQAGVDPVDAVITVRIVYGLTPLETDSVITAAINALSPDANIVPLVALYSTGSGLGLAVGSAGTQGIGDTGSSGGGTCVTPSDCPVSPN